MLETKLRFPPRHLKKQIAFKQLSKLLIIAFYQLSKLLVIAFRQLAWFTTGYCY
jgi:hypothetical protein